jgi:hypothetical protein
MFVYVDESGDAGFKFGRGSSDFFVLGIVITENPVPIATALVNLKAGLGIRQRDEIKFNKSSERVRQAFLQELRKHDLRICGFCVNKRLLVEGTESRTNPWLYGTMLSRALKQHCHHFLNATVVLDEHLTTRNSKRALSALLRTAIQDEVGTIDGINVMRVREILHRGAETEPLL